MSEHCCVHAKRAQWRPISEIHEDYGPVVVIDITDAGTAAVVWGGDFLEPYWTHFAQLPELTSERADELEKELSK